MNKTAIWNYPTSVRFGVGRIKELPALCKSLGMLKPLLVTDRGLASAAITQAALDSLHAAELGAALFSDIKPNPVGANLDAGLAAYRQGQHDGVIAFGGGSALDMGKLIAFMSGQKRPVWDFEDVGDWWTRANPKGIAPVIAVPTTAGTGSEVGRAGILTDETHHLKRIIFHPQMLPKIVISDPQLTVGMPAWVTAGTGLDAFSHCLEAYCAPGFHPMADGIALEGMRLVDGALIRAVQTPNDLDARADMLAAAAMGATAFQKGLGAMHALAHPIGALYDSHHGMTNAVLMPYVLKFNRTAVEERIGRLAAYLGLANPGFDSFLERILELRAECQVPHSLEGLGVDDRYANQVAQMAPNDPSAGTNPCVLSESNCARLFDDALYGRL